MANSKSYTEMLEVVKQGPGKMFDEKTRSEKSLEPVTLN
jgi:hypothetical protein